MAHQGAFRAGALTGMFSSLQARLFLTYLVIIALTLGVIGLALVVLLVNSAATTAQVYRHLTDIARASGPYVAQSSGVAEMDQRLGQVASENDVRVVRLNAQGRVAFDSAGRLATGQALDLKPAREAVLPGPLQRGTFTEAGGSEWLTISASRAGLGTVILTLPRPQNRITAALGENLSAPLLEAGGIGLVLALLFAILISNWVSRPLGQTAAAARAIAAGDYGRQAPEKGPREVRDMARSFNQMSRQVQQTQATQRDFLANVSHELKTPLTSIQGFAQAVLDGAAARPAEAAQVIYDEAARMRRLVEDLLELARLESGQTPIRHEVMQLGAILEASAARFQLRAGQQGVALSCQIDPLPPIVGDPDRVAQVATNLLDNALIHTPSGGRIDVRARPEGQGVEFSVQDTGKGIPPEDIDRIFERFYQADKSRARSEGQGTGLGLTISREIVQSLGGTIRAESPAGSGAAFIVWLPTPHPTDQTATRRKTA